jgi:hypothetical protein
MIRHIPTIISMACHDPQQSLLAISLPGEMMLTADACGASAMVPEWFLISDDGPHTLFIPKLMENLWIDIGAS